MGMDVGGSKKGARSDINVTPLIDVVLVLLIIFMVLTPTTLKHMTANVPRKQTDQQNQPDVSSQPIILEYTAKRELTVNHEPVATEGLADKLSERLKAQRQKVVFFKAEDEAPYGEVVRLLDIAKGSGAATLAIVTE